MNDSSLEYLRKDLFEALMKFSNGKLNEEMAEKIVDRSYVNVDWENSILSHKGPNWYAKFILESLKLK